MRRAYGQADGGLNATRGWRLCSPVLDRESRDAANYGVPRDVASRQGRDPVDLQAE